MRTYLALTFDVPNELADLAAWLLHEEEAGGVELRDHEILPPPGMKPLPEGRSQVIGFFEGEVDGEAIADAVRSRLEEEAMGHEIRVGVSRLKDEDWAETWKLHFQPLHVAGKIWVLPPWEKVPAGSLAVVIEPGMAFGTGGHATTSLCLEGLVEVLERRPGAAVLDVGCGSGILGIGAKLLGAGRVVMIDNDPVAVQVAKENAAKNGVPEIETSGTGIEAVAERFPVVVANILAVTLIDLVRPIVATVEAGGELLLSGILVGQADDVIAAYEKNGMRLRDRRTRGDWALVWMERA
ncbi:50S ribosomal protein L11 methyltransferase [Vulgatibacter sp.]|uniref:50S ribosomal protein L11 methyltransferase n=1 Tax=Vulgatibacter sp. TaxID=1971226 RepID=UPI00356A539A